MRLIALPSEAFNNLLRWSSFEGFFASKGAAYALPDGDFARRATKHGGEMQLHLQAMVNLLRDEDVLRLVVKLESQYPNKIRYLTIVSAFGPDEEEQSIVMGVDWTDKASIGLVVPLYRDTVIKLDGDGGFKMTSADKTNIFKPVSVQTMWTALQWIHKCSENARRNNYYYPNGSSHAWVDYYYRKISSDRLCMNEWQQMDDIESKRPESPIGTSTEKELVMKLIRHKLKEVMTRVDLEDVTCRQIRTILEKDTQMELKEYRSFIDEEMITILGQMDSASKIFDHVYLGSEWNASNLEELKDNGIGFILNITREIDNFFPGTFCYHNIRVYDLDETELLHHWDYTYKFIQRAKDAGSKVLVHCRMGISRSASTVIAYGMKEYGWTLGETMKYVKARRSVVQPNAGFWKQLITYEGILNSSKHRYNRLFRHGSFSSDAEELSKSAAGAVQKGKIGSSNTFGETDEQPDGVDTVDNWPTVTEAESIYKEGELSVETKETSGVVQATSENADDVCISEETSQEGSNADYVPTTSSPTASGSESTVEPRKDVLEETNSVQASFKVSEIIEKSSLQRVSSVPALSSDDQKGQESDAESTGNFRRSCSLRERGPRKLHHLQTVAKVKSASDENLKGFERKKKEILDLEETTNKESQDTKSVDKKSAEDLSSVETELESVGSAKTHGSLPRDLDGVLESGFVKRHSRKFEEGVHYLPSVTPSDDAGSNAQEEVNVALPSTDTDSDKITEGEQERDRLEKSHEDEEDLTVPSEEPEPGVVRKHKEGYELKHRESLKRRALLQRGGSDETKSIKREGDEMDGASVADSDSSLMRPEEGLESERVCGVNVEALVQKVNEDMKKTVSARRISASKKEQELRAFVQQAGEQMKVALDDVEDETSKAGSNNSVSDKVASESEEVSDIVINERNTEKDSEERLSKSSLLTGTSTQCRQPVALKGETKRSTLNVELSKPCVAQNVSENVNSGEKNSPVGVETSELSGMKENGESAEDSEDVPQRGLVQRHTLLIEGKLQPPENELGRELEDQEGKEGEDTVDREVEKEITKSEDNDVEQVETSVAQALRIRQVEAEMSALSKDKEDEDGGSERDTANIPEKGLVKRHTLLIEGKLQPLDQELDKKAGKEEGIDGDPAADQEVYSSSLEGETRQDVESAEQNAAQSVIAGVECSGKSVSDGTTEASPLVEQGEVKVCESEEDIPQKGLVKRHTLLIEGMLQPLDQEEENAERDNGNDCHPMIAQEALPLPLEGEGSSQDRNTEHSELNVTQGLKDIMNPVAEGGEASELAEVMEDRGSAQDTENIPQKGTVKRHTLLIEGKLQPLDQELDKDVEKEEGKEGELSLENELGVDQGQLRYQIERTCDPTGDHCDEDNHDNKSASGLVKREKLRIEERLYTTVVEAKQEQEQELSCSDSAAVVAGDGVEDCQETDGRVECDGDEEQIQGDEQSDICVDTSSVVKVKKQTEHLEGIIRVTHDGDKVNRQTSKDEEPKSCEQAPKVVIVPRSCSDETMDDRTGDKAVSEDRMEVLSDSAVNKALIRAQENLDLEKGNFYLGRENVVDWEFANVRQRTQIFEAIMGHFDKNNKKDDEESEHNSNSLRRHESMSKMFRASEKPPMRRRSVSDVTKTVSSGSGREVGYTIQFKNRTAGSSSSSSLPRDWSPIHNKQKQEDKELYPKVVFSSEIIDQDELKEKSCAELIDNQDKENQACQSVKEAIQALDSKNQKNISSNIS